MNKISTTKPGKMTVIVAEDAPVKAPPLFSCNSVRLRVAILLFLGMTTQNLMRNTLAMGVVCMMNTTWLEEVSDFMN
jgi:hypothetical protein